MVSETKLKRDSLLINIEIKEYIFFHADSTTNAGVVGIYIKCKFNPYIYDDASQIHGSEYIFKITIENIRLCFWCSVPSSHLFF